MTDPHKPLDPALPGQEIPELPVLTDIVDDIDVPAFDFSAEMAAKPKGAPEGSEDVLDIPPDLLLEEVVDIGPEPGDESSLDFSRLPSLDLEVAVPEELSLDELLGEGAAESTPAGMAVADATPSAPGVALDMPILEALDDDFTVPDAVAAPVAAAGSPVAEDSPPSVSLTDMLLDAARNTPVPDEPVLEAGDAEMIALLGAEMDVPDLSDELAEAEAPIPVLEEPVAVDDAAAVAEMDVPDLSDELAEAETLIPVLEEPVAVDDAAAVAEIDVPDLSDELADAETLIPVLEEPVAVDDAAAVAEIDVPDLSDELADAETLIPVLEEPVAVDDAAAVAEIDVPDLSDELADAETLIPVLEEPVAGDEAAAVAEMDVPDLSDELADAETLIPVLEEPVAVDDAATVAEIDVPDLSDELADSVVDVSVEAPESPLAGEDDFPIDLTPSGADAPVMPAPAPSSFQSISLTSLPRGVLGGNLGSTAQAVPSRDTLLQAARDTLADELQFAKLQAAAAALGASSTTSDTSTSLFAKPHEDVSSAMPFTNSRYAEQIRAAEARLAEELQLAEQRREEEARVRAEEQARRQAAIAAAAEAAAKEEVPAAAAVPVVPHAVSVIKVAGVAAASAAAHAPAGVGRGAPIALVNEGVLIESLYQRILPHMKVELSMWLQDALEAHARQMMANVMHQFQEDYEMLFSDTLRESLRQAVGDLSLEDHRREDES